MPTRPPALTRRTTLAVLGVGVGAGLVALSGCEDDDTTTPTAGPTADATPTSDPDSALVDRVLGELTHAAQLAAAASFPELAALHRAHIEALDGDPAAGAGGAARAGAPAVRRAEQRLQHSLVDAAMQADSGALARLLASMSAAVSQRLTHGLA